MDFTMLETALQHIYSSLNAYLKGNRAEIYKLEQAIDQIDRELVPVMSKESPEKLLEYLARKVELNVAVEELKVKKGVSIATLLKGWAPALAPLLAAVMAFIGVLIGAQIQTDSSQKAFAREGLSLWLRCRPHAVAWSRFSAVTGQDVDRAGSTGISLRTRCVKARD